jgi:hypothetical protein
MHLAFVPSYAVLCIVQGLLVVAPWRPFRIARSSVLGLLVPAALLGAGVGIVNAFSAGAGAMTTLAAVATPLLAAFCGPVRGWRFPWATAVVAAGLYGYAWRGGHTLGTEGAKLALISLACLTGAALVASVAPKRALALGLVLLVILDVALVWGDRQVAPTTIALHQAHAPRVGLPGAHAVPLPSLQDITFGTALMGWLDVLAPAVLSCLVAGAALQTRAIAALATTGAALCWSLLLVLHVTNLVPATVPVLVGLAAALASERSDRLRRALGGSSAARAPSRLLDERPDGSLEPLS